MLKTKSIVRALEKVSKASFTGSLVWFESKDRAISLTDCLGEGHCLCYEKTRNGRSKGWNAIPKDNHSLKELVTFLKNTN